MRFDYHDDIAHQRAIQMHTMDTEIAGFLFVANIFFLVEPPPPNIEPNADLPPSLTK